MPLPTANLTLWVDASDADNLWREWIAGTPFHQTTPTNNQSVQVWDAENAVDREWLGIGGVGHASHPLWRDSSPLMMLPNLDFDGTNDQLFLYNNAGSASQAMSTVVSTTAKTIALSIYIEAVSSNSGNPWENHAVFAETQIGGGNCGLFIRSNGGAPVLQWYNFDGSIDVIESATLALNTSYVVICRHDGSNLNLRVNGTNATPVASGTTSSLSGEVSIGGADTAAFASVRIGENAAYNAALSGADLSDLDSYFTNRWLVPPPPYTGKKSQFDEELIAQAWF